MYFGAQNDCGWRVVLTGPTGFQDGRRAEQRLALITADSRFKHPQLDGWFSWSPLPSLPPPPLPPLTPYPASLRRLPFSFFFSWSPLPSLPPSSLPAINPNSVSSRRHCCCCCCCCSCRLPFGGESGSWATTPTGTLGVHIHTYTRSHSERWKCVPYSSGENSFMMLHKTFEAGRKVGLVWNEPVTARCVDSV